MTARKGDPCTIEDCPKPILGRGWCSMHYATWQRHGDPLAPIQRRLPPDTICSEATCDNRAKRRGMCDMHRRREENHGETTDPRERRFWAQVDRRGNDECWLWMGHCQWNGYGQYGTTGTRLAHRIAYQYLIGPIPEGFVVDHMCHVRDRDCSKAIDCPHRRCCNPAHAEIKRQRENIASGRGGDSWGYVPEAIPATPVIEKPLTCTEDDGTCGGEIYKRTICRKHYRRWLRDPNVERPSSRSPEQRFWAKVNKNGSVPEHVPELGPCWLWTASIARAEGYGRFGVRHGEMIGAHRYSYLLAHGSIPEGYEVHHRCHRRRCVRPDHLEALPPAQNKALRKDRR